MRLSPTLARYAAALRAMLVLTVLLGLAYPLAVLALAQVPGLRGRDAELGQSFTTADGAPIARYFQSRPSVGGYDPMATGASNLGPESVLDRPGKPSLLTQVCDRSLAVGRLEGVSGARPYCAPDGKGAIVAGGPVRGDAPAHPAVPPDAVTASASGLDPDISPAYAALQVPRVARERGVPAAQVEALVRRYTYGRDLGFLGEPRVDVVKLNRALDARFPARS